MKDIESEDIAICITNSNLDPPGPQIIFVNKKFCEITGYSEEELIGNTPRMLQGEKTDRDTLKKMKISLRNNEFFEGNIINYKKNGEQYTMVWNISPIHKENEPKQYISIQKEISEKQDDDKIVKELEIIKNLNSKILSNLNNYLNR